jgi:hypothetical protein
MRAGAGSTGPLPQDGGSDRPLGTCRGVRVAFLTKGLRSHGSFIMGLQACLPMGLMESVSATGKYPEVPCGKSALTSQMVSTWPGYVGEVL